MRLGLRKGFQAFSSSTSTRSSYFKEEALSYGRLEIGEAPAFPVLLGRRGRLAAAFGRRDLAYRARTAVSGL